MGKGTAQIAGRMILLAALLAFQPAIARAQPSAVPSLRWTSDDAQALLAAIDDASFEGLNPDDYNRDDLRRAVAGNDHARLGELATTAALRLAGDYLQGHVRGRDRIGWHIAGPVAHEAELVPMLADALREHRVQATLLGLLPRHPEYRALRDELQRTPTHDRKRITTLRVNLERWRWMPREPGTRYILVNVPSFSLKLVEDDVVTEERRVIVGKPSTPTPQYRADVSGVIFNPWWEVPRSIINESVGALVLRNPAKAKAQGYVAARAPNGSLHVRQAPGPKNALGQMKLVMPNPFDIYLHDTPAKQLFEHPERAFSHGCIRVDNAIDFAILLFRGDPTWGRSRIDAAIANGVTTKAALAKPVPVYVTYFTAATGDDGRIAYHADLYGRDAPVIRALDDRERRQLAAVAPERGICPA